MAKLDCPRCEQIRTFIQQCHDNPPPMDFQIEPPFYAVLDGIQAIFDHKTLLELAAAKAARTGNHKDLKAYLKMRRQE